METRAKLLGHSIHQILVVFPLGLLATAVVFDAIHLATASGGLRLVAYWMIAAGIVGGFAAAPFGWIDWFAIPRGTRAKRIGLWHGLLNGAVLLMFIGSWYLRWQSADGPGLVAYVLSFGGAAAAGAGGWLGGELVSRMGVAVYDGAHLNSPSSLSGRPASDDANAPRLP